MKHGELHVRVTSCHLLAVHPKSNYMGQDFNTIKILVSLATDNPSSVFALHKNSQCSYSDYIKETDDFQEILQTTAPNHNKSFYWDLIGFSKLHFHSKLTHSILRTQKTIPALVTFPLHQNDLLCQGSTIDFFWKILTMVPCLNLLYWVELWKLGRPVKNVKNVKTKATKSINFEVVPQWEVVPDETVLQIDLFWDVMWAQLAELEKWKTYKEYDEVDNNGQEVITMQQVITQKKPDNGEQLKVKAYLVEPYRSVHLFPSPSTFQRSIQ